MKKGVKKQSFEAYKDLELRIADVKTSIDEALFYLKEGKHKFADGWLHLAKCDLEVLKTDLIHLML